MSSVRARRRLGRIGLAGLVLLLLLLVAVVAWWWPRPQTAAVFDSPDGRFRMVVVRDAFPWASMPGQAGDNPGWLVLMDRQGHELQRTRVDMVQLVEQVDWQPDRVSVRLLADWPLPAKAAGSAGPPHAAASAASTDAAASAASTDAAASAASTNAAARP